MAQRIVPLVLALLLGLLQWQIWQGRSNVAHVASLEQRLHRQLQSNTQARLVNEQLTSEIDELKTGLAMVEERARSELGMVKANEIFVQVSTVASP